MLFFQLEKAVGTACATACNKENIKEEKKYPKQTNSINFFPPNKTIAIAKFDFLWVKSISQKIVQKKQKELLIDLKNKGFDAVNIDVLPHLLTNNRYKKYTLLPPTDFCKRFNLKKIDIDFNDLISFLQQCYQLDLKVVFNSNWFDDIEFIREKIQHHQTITQIWISFLTYLKEQKCLKNIFYIDLSTNFLTNLQIPFIKTLSLNEQAIAINTIYQEIKKEFPGISLTFSGSQNTQQKLSDRKIHIDLYEVAFHPQKNTPFELKKELKTLKDWCNYTQKTILFAPEFKFNEKNKEKQKKQYEQTIIEALKNNHIKAVTINLLQNSLMYQAINETVWYKRLTDIIHSYSFKEIGGLFLSKKLKVLKVHK